MRYVGSKRRIAKYILPIILKDRKHGQTYVEPFVGGANLIDKVSGSRVGSDLCCYLIAWLKHLQDTPDFQGAELTDEQYKHVRDYKGLYQDWFVGYVGYCLSFSAKFFGGLARDRKGDRNHQQEATRNARAQRQGLVGVVFKQGHYRELVMPENSTIYCDPPYKGTLSYRHGGFDHKAFYAWCREQRGVGHTIFVSERQMPDDFECVWSGQVINSVSRQDGTQVMPEKLFKLP